MSQDFKDINERIAGRVIIGFAPNAGIPIPGTYSGESMLDIVLDDGSSLTFYHCQDCCEGVSLSDDGDLQNLIGSTIVSLEETSGGELPPGAVDGEDEHEQMHDWYFYRLSTSNGVAVIRFHGTSNGYYSTQVDVVVIEKKQ